MEGYDFPIQGTDASFEELLNRELQKENQVISQSSASASKNSTDKKEFLRKGSRGWWSQKKNANNSKSNSTDRQRDSSIRQNSVEDTTNQRLKQDFNGDIINQRLNQDLNDISWGNSTFYNEARKSWEMKRRKEEDDVAEFEKFENDIQSGNLSVLSTLPYVSPHHSKYKSESDNILNLTNKNEEMKQCKYSISKNHDSTILSKNENENDIYNQFIDDSDPWDDQEYENYNMNTSFEESIKIDDLKGSKQNKDSKRECSNLMSEAPTSNLVQQLFKSKESEENRDILLKKDSDNTSVSKKAIKRIKDPGLGLSKGNKMSVKFKETDIEPSKSPSYHLESRVKDSQETCLPSAIEEKLKTLDLEIQKYQKESKSNEILRQQLSSAKKDLEDQQKSLDESKLRIKQSFQDQLEEERKKLKKEKRALERQFKAKAFPEKKSRSEIEALKAEIVKMKLEEKSRSSKSWHTIERLRQRVADLETRNNELTEEIGLLEKERLSSRKQGVNVSTNTDRSCVDSPSYKSQKHFESQHANMSGFSESRYSQQDLNTWTRHSNTSQYHKRESIPQTATQPSSQLESTEEIDEGGGYDPRRYQYDDIQATRCLTTKLEPSEYLTYQNKMSRSNDNNTTFDHKFASNAFSASNVSTDSKREELLADKRTIYFKNGTEKDIYDDGRIVIRFVNGDIKKIFEDTGIVIYYYAQAQTTHTTYPDQLQVFEFPNNQVEKHFPDGMKEILFADGTLKIIHANGDEKSKFPDGTVMIEYTNGSREIYNSDGSFSTSYPSEQSEWMATDDGLNED